MNRWLNILLPFASAVAAGWLLSVAFWDASKQGLLVGLSVIAAGVLVRLARGLPFTTADQYEVDEIRGLTGAVRQIARSLRVLIIFVLINMIGLVSARPLLDFVIASPTLATYAPRVEAALSGILAFLMSYVLWRMLQVVRGDLDLTELQSKFVVRAVERRQAKRFDEQKSAVERVGFKAPDGYGKRVQ